jgi:hypothetical protein
MFGSVEPIDCESRIALAFFFENFVGTSARAGATGIRTMNA